MVEVRQYRRTQVRQAAQPQLAEASVESAQRVAEQTSLGDVGAAVAGVGETLYDWQDEIDTADAKAADANYSSMIREALYGSEDGFMYTQGGAAVSSHKAITERLHEAKAKALEGLTGGASRRAESAMKARLDRALSSVDSHMNTQRKEYMGQASAARVVSATQDAIFAPELAGQSVKIIRQEVIDRGAREGWPAERTQLELQKATSDVHSGIIKRVFSADPVSALEYYKSVSDSLLPSEAADLERVLIPAARKHRGRTAAQEFLASAIVSEETRAVNKPSSSITNISLDFNASADGGARGTEVIVPDNASPEMIEAANRFNQKVVEFASKHGIAHPNRGVRTRSENGRGVNNTVHVEPFFNDNLDLQTAIQANMEEFSKIYMDTFGTLEGVRIIPPHGVGADRGAASSVFGNETEFGKEVVRALIAGDPRALNRAVTEADVMSHAATIENKEEREAFLDQANLLLGARRTRIEQERSSVETFAFELIEGGGSIDDLPVDMRRKIGREAMNGLRSYQTKLASGETIKTDDAFYVQLSDLMSQSPDEFMRADPMMWRAKLDDQDFQYFVNKRSGLIEGKREASVDAPSISSLRTASKTALKAAGFDDDPEFQSQFETSLLRWSAAYTEENGAAPSPIEVNDRINQMMVPVVIDPSGFGNKQKGMAFQIDYDGSPLDPNDDLTPEMVRGNAMKINDIPVSNEMLGLFAQSYVDRFGRAPTVREMVEGMIEAGLYDE